MELRRSGLRTGLYVDVENTTRNGGRGMRFDVLRDFACRDGGDALRLNAYLAYDAERARHDVIYRNNATGFHFAMRSVGFKVIEKPVQWYTNEDGVRVSKANSDLDLAVDMLLQSAKLDRVVLISGDGDFVQVVRALQNMGCRVGLIGFQNAAYDILMVYDYAGGRQPVVERDRDRGDFRGPVPERGPVVEREPRQLITEREQRSPVLLERYTPQHQPAVERERGLPPEDEGDEE